MARYKTPPLSFWKSFRQLLSRVDVQPCDGLRGRAAGVDVSKAFEIRSRTMPPMPPSIHELLGLQALAP